MMSFRNPLPTSHIFDSFDVVHLTSSDVDLGQPTSQAADQPGLTKYEPVDDIALHPGSVKDDDTLAAALLVKKTSPEQPVWNTSQDLTTAVFGGDSTVAAFDVHLNSDVYLKPNKETATNIFLNPNASLIPTSVPDETPEMYYWRGDCGLLDRFSYDDSGEIPLNWKMTSLDPAKVQARIASGPPAFFSESTDVRPISDLPFDDQEEEQGVSNSIPPVSQSARSADSSANEATATSRDVPKAKGLVGKKQSNNRFGRKGNLRCLRCRRRKKKCTFTSEDSPCEFCQANNYSGCIKVAPQKVPGYSLTSIPVLRKKVNEDLAAVLSSSTRPNSVLTGALTRFSHNNNLDSPTLDLAFIIGSPDLCLQYAVAALGNRLIDDVECARRASMYEAQAIASLNSAISESSQQEQHVFAANILGWLAYTSCSNTISAPSHFKGSFAILDWLLTFPTNPRRTLLHQNKLFIFGPFIIDCAVAWSVRAGVLPSRNTNFRQRTEYFEQFRISSKAGTWYSGILEASNSTLGNVLEVALNTVCQTVTKEIALDFSRETVGQALLYIRSELGDVDLQNALWQLYESFQEDKTDHSTVEGQLITRMFHRMRVVLLLEAVLEAPSVKIGVLEAKTNAIAQVVISFCQRQTSQRDANRVIQDYFLMSWHNFSHLLLGGMSLSPVDTPDRNLL